MTPELQAALDRANAVWNSMTPAQKAKAIDRQRESWIRAFEPCPHGIVDFEECAQCRK